MIHLTRNFLKQKAFLKELVKCNMSKTALVFLAPGAEEMETVITVDVLRRGGIEVMLAGVDGPDPVLCSRNVKLVPDDALENVRNNVFDAVIIPGGLKGAEACANVES
jgi:protein DJ-1